MLFIGICGASGSGKSTLADELVKGIGVKSVVINQDAYYLDHPDKTHEERAKLNFDEPNSIDHELILRDISELMAGRPITRKAYNFTEHRRCDRDELIEPAEVLIIEGIHAFHDPELIKRMFIKLYISVEPDICLLRRISRDITERGRQIDDIGQQYLSSVKPMYDKYIRNYIHEADVVVMRGGKNARIVDILAGYLRDVLQEQHKASDNPV